MSEPLLAQTTHYGQFRNEFAFTKSLGKGWAAETNVGQLWAGSSTQEKVFSNFAQWYLQGWVHYFASARWKAGLNVAYYSNSEVKTIDQAQSNEWRWAFQGIYYFNKIGYTLTSRTRFENRGVSRSEDLRETVFRFRQQIKFVKPLGGNKTIREGVIYTIVSDEIMLRAGSNLEAEDLFDRNRFTFGGGYAFSDNFQVELSYLNDFLPRDNKNSMYHTLMVKVIMNNFLERVKKSIKRNNTTETNAD